MLLKGDKKMFNRIAAWIIVCLAFAADARTKTPDPQQPATPMQIGGTGGVYLLAEPGELVIDVMKRDRNRKGVRTELRAILAGPDRRVIQDVVIPDDGLPPGKMGPSQQVHLAAHVPRKGVYVLNITVSQDRYGEQILWGFHTNCPHYLIETSRGHRDARHEEPLVLENPDRPGDVCFLPTPKAFAVELSGLPKNAGRPAMYDSSGTLVATLSVDAQGQASHRFPAAAARGGAAWRLHLPSAKAIVQIDGLTRWNRGDLYPELSLWTPTASSFFPLHPYRWLLTPYNLNCYGTAGGKGEAVFTIQNNSGQARTVQLGLEFDGPAWPARLLTDRITLKGKQAQQVRVEYDAPDAGQPRECTLRATPVEDPGFSTWSTLKVTGGAAPASKPLAMPIVLKAYRHENEQFGYLPEYPIENQPYFDPQNRPFMRVGSGVATYCEGKWVTREMRTPGMAAQGTKIAFDSEGHLYLPGVMGGRAALLESADGGQTFSASTLPGTRRNGGTLEIEDFTGHNAPDGPPPLLRYTQTARDPRLIWRRVNDLELFIPKKVNGRVSVGEPVLVSRMCIGMSSHSGVPSNVVSRGGRIHVVWAETTDPAAKVPGVPTYVASFDRDGHRLGEPALVGYGPPANDIHNTPSITIDSKGYLHVLVGTHGKPFPYARSLQPDTAHSGWTKPVPVAEGQGLTYIGMVCGPDDTLHLVCRYWRTNQEPFPAGQQGTLACLRKTAQGAWEAPRVLVVPPFSEYSVYYHRLTIDRLGRLLLSYNYWSTYWFYRNDHPGDRRALLASPDGGQTWKLAETSDLVKANNR